MPTDRNAALAQALAPVLGEAAVYAETVYICSNGHINTRCTPNYEWGNECIECDGGARIDDSIQLPVDFADPAVGWGLWERYTYYNPLAFTVEPGGAGEGFHVRIHPIYPQDDEHGPHGYGRGPRIIDGLISAWAQALGVSGDA